MKLLVLLICTAVLAFASAAVVKPDDNTLNEVGVDKSSLIDDINDDTDVIDVTDDDSDDDGDVDDPDDIDDETEIDGVVLKYLTTDEIHELLDEEDNIVISEIDIIVAGKIVKQRETGTITDAAAQTGVSKGGRPKRWVGIAARLFQAGRTLFRASRAGRTTTSGTRVTRQYQRPGNMGDANRDFDRFRPDNVREFNGRISGRTGTVGNHRVTVRDGSSSGRPTLEIRSPRTNGEYVRKFRYDQQ